MRTLKSDAFLVSQNDLRYNRLAPVKSARRIDENKDSTDVMPDSKRDDGNHQHRRSLSYANRLELILPTMNEQILSRTIRESSLFNPSLKIEEPLALGQPNTSRSEMPRMMNSSLSALPAAAKIKPVVIKRGNTILAKGNNFMIKKGTATGTALGQIKAAAAADANQPTEESNKEDKNLKPFSCVDSYNETRERMSNGFSRADSVDAINRQLHHNQVEKTKYLNFFDSLKKTGVNAIIQQNQDWVKKIEKMPRKRVISKAARQQAEEAAQFEDDSATVDQVNLMTRPTEATNAVLSQILGNKAEEYRYSQAKKYDTNKISARWVMPPASSPAVLSEHNFVEAREGGTMCLVGNKFWIIGGHNTDAVYRVMVYDTVLNQFSKPTFADEFEVGKRFNHSMVSQKQFLYLFGGEVLGLNSVFTSKMVTNSMKIINTSRLLFIRYSESRNPEFQQERHS